MAEAESKKIEGEIFESGSDLSDEELWNEVRILPNARAIYGDDFPHFLRLLLLTNLSKTTPMEKEIGEATTKAIKTLNWSRSTYNLITHEQICQCLNKAGYNSTICNSKWRQTWEMLGGQHTYIQIITNAPETAITQNFNKIEKRDTNIIVELNFQDEFTIFRPTRECESLVSLLPEVFVGNDQKLKNLVKIMCYGLGICMEEKKMYMGGWRMEIYMQQKWKKILHDYDEDSYQELNFYHVDLENRKPRALISLLTLELSKP